MRRKAVRPGWLRRGVWNVSDGPGLQPERDLSNASHVRQRDLRARRGLQPVRLRLHVWAREDLQRHRNLLPAELHRQDVWLRWLRIALRRLCATHDLRRERQLRGLRRWCVQRHRKLQLVPIRLPDSDRQEVLRRRHPNVLSGRGLPQRPEHLWRRVV